MRNRVASAIASVALSLVISCGDDESKADGQNNTSNGSECVPGMFEDTQVFDNDGALPFTYEIPLGFGSIDSSTPEVIAGSTYDTEGPGGQGVFLNHFSILRAPTAPDIVALGETGWLDAGAVEIELDYDGSAIRGFETAYPDRTVVHTYLPVDGELYQTSLQWHGPEDCAVQWQAIRTEALATLAPNADAVFP